MLWDWKENDFTQIQPPTKHDRLEEQPHLELNYDPNKNTERTKVLKIINTLASYCSITRHSRVIMRGGGIRIKTPVCDYCNTGVERTSHVSKWN